MNTHVLCVAFSADGRMLALCGGTFGVSAEMKLVELRSGKVRAELKAHKEWVETVRFSPSGKMLVSGGGTNDTKPAELNFWHLTDLQGPKPKAKLLLKEIESLWNDLAGDDAVKAFRAMGPLAGAGDQAADWMKDQFQHVPAVDGKKVEALIRDLDSDTFVVREKASVALEVMGEIAEESLRKALKDNPPLEVQVRLQQLLTKLEQPSAKRLQEFRAVEVLEMSGSAQARHVLEKLAKEMPTTRLTLEAQDAVKRLAQEAKR